jgi:hypothetical protein
MEETIEWSGYRWLCRERWGSIHPGKSWNWYDPTAVRIERDNLLLDIHYNPRQFTFPPDEWVDEEVTLTSDWGIGLVTCETDFSFGRFEICARLPKGRGLWPAFWMYAPNTWPPEIDIFEGYSQDNNYRHWFLLKPYRIENCLHSKDGLNIPKVHTWRPWFWQLQGNPCTTFHIYSVIWFPDRLEFLIDNRVIRRITDKLILKYLAGYKMMVLMNNHIHGQYIKTFSSEKPFEIEYFLYE